MARGFNEFLKGLKIQGGEASQKEVAEEVIKKQLFIIMPDLNMENGQTVKLSEIVQMISNRLEEKANKKQIAQVVTQVFRSGEYRYKIDDNGNIEASFSTADILQKSYEDKVREEAAERLQEFVQKVEQYAKELSQQKIRVTEYTLMNKFSEEDLERNESWINLAIDYVLEKQNQER